MLEISNQGAVWNFPALKKGYFETSVYIPEGSQGGRISLNERWFNPCDTTAYMFAMYNFELSSLEINRWYDLRFEWELNDDNNSCKVMDAEGIVLDTLQLNKACMNGISYVHFISTAHQEDDKGFLIGPVKADIIND